MSDLRLRPAIFTHIFGITAPLRGSSGSTCLAVVVVVVSRTRRGRLVLTINIPRFSYVIWKRHSFRARNPMRSRLRLRSCGPVLWETADVHGPQTDRRSRVTSSQDRSRGLLAARARGLGVKGRELSHPSAACSARLGGDKARPARHGQVGACGEEALSFFSIRYCWFA